MILFVLLHNLFTPPKSSPSASSEPRGLPLSSPPRNWQLPSANDELQAARARAEAAEARVAELEWQLDQFRRDTARANLADKKRVLGALDGPIPNPDSARGSLRYAIIGVRKTLEEYGRELRASTNYSQTLETQLAELQERLNEIEAAAAFHGDYDNVYEEFGRLYQCATRSVIDSDEQTIHKDHVTEVRDAFVKQDTEIHGLRQRLEAVERELQELKRASSSSLDRQQELQTQSMEKDERIAELMRQNIELQQALEEARNQSLEPQFLDLMKAAAGITFGCSLADASLERMKEVGETDRGVRRAVKAAIKNGQRLLDPKHGVVKEVYAHHLDRFIKIQQDFYVAMRDAIASLQNHSPTSSCTTRLVELLTKYEEAAELSGLPLPGPSQTQSAAASAEYEGSDSDRTDPGNNPTPPIPPLILIRPDGSLHPGSYSSAARASTDAPAVAEAPKEKKDKKDKKDKKNKKDKKDEKDKKK